MNSRAIIYSLIWLPISFVAVILAAELFAVLSNADSPQVLSQAIAFISLFITGTAIILDRTTDRDKDEGEDGETEEEDDEAVDSPGPAVEPQSQACTFRDSDTSPPRDTADTENDREPLNRTGLRRSNDAILEEAGDKLRDKIDIYDDGTIELDGNDLDLYRKLMLYVVAKRMAYEDQFIDTPAVTVTDITDRPDLPYNKVELLLFLREARNWLVPPPDTESSLSTIDYADLDDAVFTVETRSLAKIADWILEEPLPNRMPSDISSRLSNAAMMLNEARDQYDRVREDGVTNNSYNADHRYDPVRQKILRACNDARYYPVMFERDFAWTEFTEYAEALLDFFEDSLYTKTEHCLPRMQRYQRHMKEKADDASVI